MKGRDEAARRTSRPRMADKVPQDVRDQMAELRDRIDALDEQLVRLLNDRARCALALGTIKESVGMEIYQPDREIAVLEHARGVNGGPLEGSAITRLFERIIDENRRLERCSDGREQDDDPEAQ